MLPFNLRDKLNQVQEELTSSLRTLVLSEPSSPLVIPSRHGKHFEGIRLDAGADLLNHYQFQWCRIRETSDQIYRLAEKTDNVIQTLVNYVNQQHSQASALLSSLSSVATMTSQLQKITDSLEVTEKCINETEQQLAVLEELVKDANFERQVKDFKSKSMDLQEQKFAELEQLKCQLAQEYLLKVKEQEVKQMIRAQERQAIFGEAFESEIRQYKQTGIIPKLDVSQRQTISLEEVIVEDDPSSLNQFLDE